MKNIDIPEYGPSDLVRLELLAYPTPDGLHPVERNWREVAKKLLQHTKQLEIALDELNSKEKDYNKYNFTRMKFPEPFKPET